MRRNVSTPYLCELEAGVSAAVEVCGFSSTFSRPLRRPYMTDGNKAYFNSAEERDAFALWMQTR